MNRAALGDAFSTSVSADALAWASQEVAEEIRRFAYEFGPLIEHAADVQQQLRQDPEVQKLSAAAAAAAAASNEGLLSPEALGLATRLLQVPAMRALGSSAASAGVRGLGFLTAQLEAALIIGAQAGAELVWVQPYKIGTFTTPSRVVARAWYEATLGLDVGISGTLVPYPLDLSFWFLPPEASDHMLGAFLGVVYGKGVRAELFGWVPEKPDPPKPPAAPDIDFNPFNYIYGFRLVAEIGYHAGLGVAFKGHQVISGKTLELSSYSITPSNIQAGWKYDGTATDHPLLEGVITAPKRDEQPSKTFVKTGSTLQVSFPDWLCTGLSAAPSLVFKNDGGDGTKGWLLTNTPSVSDMTYTFVWDGAEDQAWQSDIDFTISTYSTSAPSQTPSATTCKFDGLTNIGPVEVPVSGGVAKMTLSELVFTAYGNYTLIVDTKFNSIEGYDSSTITADLKVTTADSASQNDNDFYYLPNPKDATKPLIIDYTGTDKNFAGTSWYAGYQFEQQGGNPNAWFRPVFWEVGKPFADRFLYYGNWQPLTDANQKYTSTATWSSGTITNGTTLAVTLTPNAN
jgi:hypothetical protein